MVSLPIIRVSVPIRGILRSRYAKIAAEDTVPLIVWSSVEMAVTMICIGIPVTLPIWRRLLGKGVFSTNQHYRRTDENSEPSSYQLKKLQENKNSQVGGMSNASKLGLKSTQVTQIGAMTYNNSDEYILHNHTSNEGGNESLETESGLRVDRGSAIHVKDEVRVERKSGGYP